MSHTIDLRELEKKAYRSFFEDGIWDIYLGLMLLVIGGGPALLALGASLMWAASAPLAAAVLGMLIFYGGKRHLTVPRLGAVQFGAARTLRRKKTSLVLACSVLVGVTLLVLSATRSLPCSAPRAYCGSTHWDVTTRPSSNSASRPQSL